MEEEQCSASLCTKCENNDNGAKYIFRQMIQHCVEKMAQRREGGLPPKFTVVASINLKDGTHICAETEASLESSGAALTSALMKRYYTHRSIIGLPQFSSLLQQGLTINVKIIGYNLGVTYHNTGA